MAYRSSSSNTGSSNPLTVPVPSGAATDDIAIIIASSDGHNSFASAWPAGFTGLIDQALTIGGEAHQVGAAWKRLTGADSGNYSVAQFTNSLAAVLFSGRHTTDPPVATGNANNTGNSSPVSVDATGVTAVDGDDLLWAGCLNVTVAGIATGCAAPSGYTERLDFGQSEWSPVSVATKDASGAGATGTVTGTYTLSSDTAGYEGILIRIPSSGGGGPTMGYIRRTRLRPAPFKPGIAR